jgi:hypothetical protein
MTWLQPLYRYALLFEQLSVQGAAIQFPAVGNPSLADAPSAVRNRGVMEKCTYAQHQ